MGRWFQDVFDPGHYFTSSPQERAADQAAAATKEAAEKSENAQLTATRESIAAQERALAQARADNAPFLQTAPRGLATLESLVYGTPISYRQNAGIAPPQEVANPGPPPQTIRWEEFVDPATGERMSRPVHSENESAAVAEWQAKNKAYQQYLADSAAYREKVGATPEQTATAPKFELPMNFDGSKWNFDGSKYAFNFDPSKIDQDAGYQWEKKRGLEDLRTQLMAAGRPGGTVAANATARFLGDLNAAYDDKYYDRQYGENRDRYGRALSENTLGYSRGLGENTIAYDRAVGERSNYQNQLANLLNLARGAQAQVTQAGTNAANNTSNALINQGNSLANIYTNQGVNDANFQLLQGQNAGSGNGVWDMFKDYMKVRSGGSISGDSTSFGGGGSGGNSSWISGLASMYAGGK